MVGSFFPLQNDLDVARQAQSTSNPDQVPTTTSGNETSGRRLFTMDSMSEAQYMTLDIRPIGQIVRLAEDPAPTIAEVNGTFQGFTFAKARVTWQEEGSATRSIDVDIGSGLVFTVPPTFQVSADLLIPSSRNLDFLNGPGKPESFPEFGQLLFYTTVACKVTCVSSPSSNGPCLTRQVYLSNANGEPNRQYIATPPYGTRVQLTGNRQLNFRENPADLRYNFGLLTTPSGGAIPPSAPYIPSDTLPWPLPRAPFHETAQSNSQTRIPGGSNVVVASLRDGAPPTIATATFCLGVS